MVAIEAVGRLLPGLETRLSRWMYRNNRFPWLHVDSELIAFGTGAAVFRVNWASGTKVLRIYRRSLGKLPDELRHIADYYKKNYDTVLSWYGTDLVLPMEFLVLDGLPLIGSVAASLQPYIEGEKQDPFEDFSDGDLLELFRAKECVCKQFIHFAKQTLHQWQGGERCYDLLGRENLILVKQGESYRLQIADVGIFNLHMLDSNTHEKVAQLEKRIKRLAALCESAEQLRPVS
jgi:hypothetical protein